MKKLSILLFALSACLIAQAADVPKSSKRGFGENSLNYVEDLQVLAKGCTWWYNWGVAPTSTLAQYMGADKLIEYVPMAWTTNYDINALRSYYQSHPHDKYLLGFNEPNFRAQANKTPAQAAEAWPALEQLADEFGLKLVAPALNYPDGAINDGNTYQPEAWMDGFIAAYRSRYGREPRMDYLALHCYMDSPAAMISFVENFAKKYGKQVWLTEFCAWESQSITAVTQEATMIEKLALLEKSPHVFRYAWFKARSANNYPYYNLVEYPNKNKGIPAGTLTDVGFAYVNMSAYDTSVWYGVGEKIPVNQFVDETDLTSIDRSYDPQAVDSVELALTTARMTLTYQVDVPEDGAYTLIARASREPSKTENTAARIAVRDANGNDLATRNSFKESISDSNYVAIQVPVTLSAGRQRITIYKENANTCYLSMLKLVKTVDPADEDLSNVTVDKTKGKGGSGGGNVDPGENTSTDDEVVVTDVTDPTANPFQFSDNYKYYALYVDAETRQANMPDERYVNCGDNGGSQNSWNWSDTFVYTDVTGPNSFGVENGYIGLGVVGTEGWSGLGYNVNAETGDLDLSCLNNDYRLHFAVRSQSTATLDFIVNDGSGHAAHIVMGTTPFVDNGVSRKPVANFKRDGKWHSFDISMAYLRKNFGLDFRNATDYDGNLFVILAGGDPTTQLDYDAVFFYGPKDSKPNGDDAQFDITVTKVDNPSANPFQFAADNRYYMLFLDAETRSRIPSAADVREIGPNGQNRNLYPWENTVSFPATGSAPNSFGVGGAFMDVKVGTAGWSGMGYNIGYGQRPLNLTGIDNDYRLHFAVRSTATTPIEFVLIDGAGHEAQIVLGATAFDGHDPLADFERDGTWHSIDVPISLLSNRFGIDYSTSTNFTGNIFNILAGGVANTEFAYDALFIYGPAKTKEFPDEETIDERKPVMSAAADAPFQFAAGNDYYVVYLDDQTAQAIPEEHYTNIGPNGQNQNLFPWEGTVKFVELNAADPDADTNSFGVKGKYMLADMGYGGWSGFGYNIEGSGADLSAIDSRYTLHFALKQELAAGETPSTLEIVINDGNGKTAYLPVGTEPFENHACVAEFPQDGKWYNYDIPVSYLVRQGLDFRTAKFFKGNIFVCLGGPKMKKVGFDAIFFYGPSQTPTGISLDEGLRIKDESNNPSSLISHPSSVYDLQGRKVADHLSSFISHPSSKPGIYIVNGKKILVK